MEIIKYPQHIKQLWRLGFACLHSFSSMSLNINFLNIFDKAFAVNAHLRPYNFANFYPYLIGHRNAVSFC